MLSKTQVESILTEAGVLHEGHFLLTSGKHSDKYMQCANVFRSAKYSEILCSQLAAQFADAGVTLVVGPAMGAVQMAYEVSRGLNCENFFTEREGGTMVLRRGFSVSKNQKVLVVEDVVTTGGTVVEVIELLKSFGANVVGVGCLVDRTGGKNPFGNIPLKSVYQMTVNAWEPKECPLCKQGESQLTKPGSRKLKV